MREESGPPVPGSIANLVPHEYMPNIHTGGGNCWCGHSSVSQVHDVPPDTDVLRTVNEAPCPHTRRLRTNFKTDNVLELVDTCASCHATTGTFIVWRRHSGYDVDALAAAADLLRDEQVMFVGPVGEVPTRLAHVDARRGEVIDDYDITLEGVDDPVQYPEDLDDHSCPFHGDDESDLIASMRARGAISDDEDIAALNVESDDPFVVLDMAAAARQSAPSAIAVLSANIATLRSRIDEQSRVIDQQRQDINALEGHLFALSSNMLKVTQFLDHWVSDD